MNFFLTLALLAFPFGFNSKVSPIELLDKKVSGYSKFLLATNKLRVTGTGRGLRDGKIAIVGADYEIVNIIQIEEARKNIIKLTEFYLHKINNDPDLQALLLNGQLSYLNLELGISYKQPNGTPSTKVVQVFTQGGFVVYSRYDQVNGNYERIYKEPYEEASAIVNGKKNISE